MQIPAKTFELLIAGRELLFFCENDSDTARVAKQLHGIKVASGDPTELRDILSDLYDRHVRQGTSELPGQDKVANFSREIQNAAFLEVLCRATTRNELAADRTLA
jgi:hypothetical protein